MCYRDLGETGGIKQAGENEEEEWDVEEIRNYSEGEIYYALSPLKLPLYSYLAMGLLAFFLILS